MKIIDWLIYSKVHVLRDTYLKFNREFEMERNTGKLWDKYWESVSRTAEKDIYNHKKIENSIICNG